MTYFLVEILPSKNLFCFILHSGKDPPKINSYSDFLFTHTILFRQDTYFEWWPQFSFYNFWFWGRYPLNLVTAYSVIPSGFFGNNHFVWWTHMVFADILVSGRYLLYMVTQCNFILIYVQGDTLCADLTLTILVSWEISTWSGDLT